MEENAQPVNYKSALYIFKAGMLTQTDRICKEKITQKRYKPVPIA